MVGKEYPEEKVREVLNSWANKAVESKLVPSALLAVSWAPPEPELAFVTFEEVSQERVVEILRKALELAVKKK